MFCKHNRTSVEGFSLLELLITIVVLGIAAVSLMSFYSSTGRGTVSPLIQHQALAIAEAYMEEIQLKAFDDPDGSNVGETRVTFDNVSDYDGLNDNGARDQNNTVISGLGSYVVSVSVAAQALGAIPSTDALLIQVSVNHPAISPITISGFRMNF